MKKIKTNLFMGFLYVSILGTLAHFIYQWSGKNPLVGLFTPVNESTWEHMKLLFFPALLYMPIALQFLKDEYPDIAEALALGILAGTLFIPVFFYTYQGVLGFSVMALDITSFFIAVAITFITAYKLAMKNKSCSKIAWSLIILFAFCFIFFTYNPPTLGIFKDWF